MRVPESWLGEFVDLELGDGGLEIDELVEVMSLHGLEVEGVARPGSQLRDVVTARVVERRPHPDADDLQVVVVGDGSEQTEVVCGAWNFEAGDVVAHARVGGQLPGGMRLEARSIRGVTSHGMLCSPRELELGEDHSGLAVLAPDTPVGVPVTELLPLGEAVIDVAVFANRGDHHSILGIARELAAILDLELQAPQGARPPGAATLPVTIEAEEGCRQFLAWELAGPSAGRSPWWLRRRLEVCGVRAISPVVDVTNYVMLELGQPLHAFDLPRLRGPELRARWARDGERLVTLDGAERALEPTDVVVADAERAVALGGVMGGADTEVGPDTFRVVLEAATWNPDTVRETSRRLGLSSEASMRFARGVDPGVAEQAVARAAGLLAEVSGARSVGLSRAGESGGGGRAQVALDTDWCARFLGLDGLQADTQADYLRRLGCEVSHDDGDEPDRGVLRVVPPTWRRDLERPADLTEEVARLHGYQAIPSRVPHTSVAGGLTAAEQPERQLGRICRSFGFHELSTRPFVGDQAMGGVVPTDHRVALSNPLAQDAAALRPSLVEGLLGAVRTNVGQGRPGVALFEIGRIFRPGGDRLESVLDGHGTAWRWRDPDGRPLPCQPRTVGLVAQGLRHGPGWLDPEQHWELDDVLAALDEIVRRLGSGGGRARRLTRDQQQSRPGLHPGRTAVLRLDGVEVGVAGQLHPEEAERRDLPEPVVLGELLAEVLLGQAQASGPAQAVPLSHHPAVTVDVALVADEDVGYAALERAVREGAGELLEELWWFDEYRGEQVGEGRRSLAVRLRLQSAERQLSDADAERVIDAVEARAEELGASLRR